MLSFVLYGVPVTISFWSLLMVLLFWLDGGLYIKKMYPDATRRRYQIAGVIVGTVTLASVIIHEFSHAIVAKAFGVQIVGAGLVFWGAYVQPGQALSELNPWAEILIAAAGPFSNLLIGGLAVIPVALLAESLFENSLQYVSYINIRLGRLNLLPLFILDGSKVVHGIFKLMFAGNNEWASQATTLLGWGVVLYYIALFFIDRRSKGKIKRRRLEDLVEEL